MNSEQFVSTIVRIHHSL